MVTHKTLLTITILLLIPLVTATPGDIYFIDYGGNVSLTNLYTGNTNNFGYDTAATYPVLNYSGQGTGQYITNVTQNRTVLYNFSFVLNDSGAGIAGGYQEISFGNKGIGGIDGVKLSMETGFCNQLTNDYIFHNDSVNCPATYTGYNSLGARSAGTHRYTFLINQSLGNVSVYVDGVFNQSRRFTPGNLSFIVISGQTSFKQYKYTNITLCDTYCALPSTALNTTNMTINVSDATTGTLISGWSWNYTTTNTSDNNTKNGYCTTTVCSITNKTGTLNITVWNITGYYLTPYDSPTNNYAYGTNTSAGFHAYNVNITINNISNIINNTAILRYCGNITNYSSDSTSNCTQDGTLRIGKIKNISSITLYNIDNGTYYNITWNFETGYNNQTLILNNNTYQGLAQINFTDLDSRSINDRFVVYNQNVNNYSSGPLTIYVNNGTNNLNYNNTRYWNNSNNFTITGISLQTITATVYNISNAYLTFIGGTSGTTYTPTCSVNGSYETRSNNYYSMGYNATNLVCDAGSVYPQTNYTIAWNSTAVNYTLTINEYSIFLNFSTNVTGNVTWTQPNDAGQCCTWPGGLQNSTAGYNITSFKYIVVTSKFAQDDHVTITFNTQSNNTLAQYYEFFNDRDAVLSDKIGVLGTINILGWASVVNYGNDNIIGAVIRVMYYPSNNISNGLVIQQRITQSVDGTATPGTPLYLDRDLDYIITTTKSGYKTNTIKLKGIDFENNGGIQIQLAPLDSTQLTDILLGGATTYTNETNIVLSITAPDQNYLYYDTTYNAAKTQVIITNGGGNIIIQNNTNYLTGNNITLNLYTYNSTSGAYTNVWTQHITYGTPTTHDVTPKINVVNTILTAFLWIALIILSSVIGTLIKKDGNDTGYYIFGAGAILLGFIYTTLMPVSVIMVLSALGSTIFTSTRE